MNKNADLMNTASGELNEDVDTAADVAAGIKRVSMYQDSSGRVHLTRREARDAENLICLRRMVGDDENITGEGMADWIIDNAADIWPLLKAIAEARKAP